MSTVIAVSNQKGGVGKTTTSINVAAAVARHSRKVLLIDLDPQGNATSGLGIDKSRLDKNVYTVLTHQSEPEFSCIGTELPGLYLLPSSISLAGAEVELLDVEKREYVLRGIISALRNVYDYIFIDCPPSLTVLTINALTASDSILVPIQCEFFALEGLGQLMNTVKLVKQHLNPGLEINGVVCTMYDSRTNLSLQVVQEVKKYFASKVYQTCIPRNIRLAEAPSYGMPIELYDSNCTGAQAYRELAKELIKRAESESVNDEQ